MITLADVRRMALALPKTTEGTHFRMPAFKVRGTNFVGLDKDHSHAMLYLAEPEANAAVAADPGLVEELRRFDKPIGVQVDLAAVTPERRERLIVLAWRHWAPKKLAAGMDQEAGGQR